MSAILDSLTLEQLERRVAGNRARGIAVSPQLRQALERRRRDDILRRVFNEDPVSSEELEALARERPRGVREFRYEGRYILADGRPRRFVTYSSNRSDAAAAIERQAREALGDAFAAARCEGTERAQ